MGLTYPRANFSSLLVGLRIYIIYFKNVFSLYFILFLNNMLPSFNNPYLKVCSFGKEISLSQSASSFLSANPLFSFSFSFFHFPVCIFLKNAFCYPFSQDFPSEAELHSKQTSLIFIFKFHKFGTLEPYF